MIHSYYNVTTPPFREGLFEPHQACLKSVWTLLGIEVSSTHHHLHLQYVDTELSPSVSLVCEYWKHHHLYIQYRNMESPSSESTVCKYWNIIYIFNMGILKSSSSISSVWEYWNHHHHLYIQYRNTESPSSASTVSSSASYLICRNTGFLRVTSEHRVLCHHNYGYHIESL